MVGRTIGLEVWRSRRVLVTGHTGFKGSWLSLWLDALGAEVSGLSLPPPTQPSLHELLDCNPGIQSHIVDIRDASAVRTVVMETSPEFVFHLAAQPIVRDSYEIPLETFETNVMGTANLLDTCRDLPDLQALVVVTSDKVYDPAPAAQPYTEQARLGGHDPYSASKAAAELTTTAWRRSFFEGQRIATARAGNVIGGGDWGNYRLIPDIVRAVAGNRTLHIRYPAATRPWQHVLEPLYGYLLLAGQLAAARVKLPAEFNFGPRVASVVPVAELLKMCSAYLPDLQWTCDQGPRAYESPALAVDANLAERLLGWRPVLSLDENIRWTFDWYRRQSAGDDARELCLEQIAAFTEAVSSP